MVESDLTFGQSTPNQLMAVSKDNRVLNSEHVPNPKLYRLWKPPQAGWACFDRKSDRFQPLP